MKTAESPPPAPGGRRHRRRLWIGVTATIALLAIIAAAAGPLMSRVEQPVYAVETADGQIEIRAYPPMIVAETAVEGERKAAINEGFRRIADYIFGANTPKEKIAMTAPVQQQQTIAMTAPVTQQGAGTAWTVRFIMPKEWTMETLPAPADARVTLRPVPARRFVAIRFSGTASAESIETNAELLRRYAAAKSLPTTGEPLLSFYDPPWTLPFLRRNEIMLELS